MLTPLRILSILKTIIDMNILSNFNENMAMVRVPTIVEDKGNDNLELFIVI